MPGRLPAEAICKSVSPATLRLALRAGQIADESLDRMAALAATETRAVHPEHAASFWLSHEDLLPQCILPLTGQ